MIRTLMVGTAVAALTVGVFAAETDAPADEYFGPFKYSAISVRTKINMLGRSYRERWTDDASIVHDAGLIESSYQVWAKKYPKDRWLAPTAFHLAQLYLSIQSDDARARAKSMFEYVAKTFPTTKEGHLSRLRLAQGFPALHAESPVSPTPNPYGAPAAGASAGPAPSDTPAPGASGSPAPAASAPASAAPAAPASSASPKPAASVSPRP